MVKHIKKAYSKDGKLTKREKSIAYATAWKDHNEEINYPKAYDPPKRKPPSEKELNKISNEITIELSFSKKIILPLNKGSYSLK